MTAGRATDELAGTPDAMPPAIRGWRLLPPLVAIASIAVIAAMLLATSKAREHERQERRLISDSLWAEQAVTFEIQRVVDTLQELGRRAPGAARDAADFHRRSLAAMPRSPELLSIQRWRADPAPRRVDVADASVDGAGAAAAGDIAAAVARAARLEKGTAAFHAGPRGATAILALPTDADSGGVVVAVLSLHRLLESTVPWWFAHETRITIEDAAGRPLAVRDAHVVGRGVYRHRIETLVVDQTIFLSTDSSHEGPLLVPNLLGLSVVGLALLLAWTVYALWRDLAMRARAETALRRQQAFRQAMEAALLAGLQARSSDGRTTYVNQAFCEMVGYGAEELVGVGPPMPYWAPETTAAELDRHRLMLRGERVPASRETTFIHRSGRRIQVLVLEAPMVGDEGDGSGWMASVLDVTEQKHGAELLRQRNERSHRASRMMTMGEMASALAHELNQPLASITSYVSAGLNVLEEHAGGGRTREAAAMFAKAKAQAERAGQILWRVRQFVHKSGPALGAVDLHDVAAEVVSLLRLQCAGTDVEIAVDIDEGAPHVAGDRILLQQILLNLMRNAFEAVADRPAPRIRLRVREDDAGALVVSVADNGPGLPDHGQWIMNSVFSTTKPDGMGMGLAICRTALELMGSRLVYGGAPEGGAEFSFALQPAAAEAAAVAES